METVLHSEAGLMLVGTVLGSLWTAFKSTEWYGRLRERRYVRALNVLEAGVDRTYSTYVRSLKQSREDGKLTKEEIRRARESARHTAVELGRTEGVDVLRELGEHHMDRLISNVVKRRKRW